MTMYEKLAADPEPRSLQPGLWLFVYLVLALNILWANRLAPFPWGNDFGGLGLTMTLMERAGWSYCISDNWGFAHTSLHYLLTLLTGDLWLTSRVICTLSLVLLLYFAEQVMRCTLTVRSAATRTVFLAILAASPLVTSLALCYYLETVAITLFMAALALLRVRKPSLHLLGGLLATAGFWFRFHFLVFGAFYAVLVYFSRNDDRPKERALWSAAGTAVAFFVSSVVCKVATGAWSVSNQKAVLAEWTSGYSWDPAYQMQLNAMSYEQLWGRINWSLMRLVFERNWLHYPPFVITLALFVLVLVYLLLRGSDVTWDQSAPPGCKRLWQIFRNPLAGLPALLLLAAIPFMVIRGERNYRLSADLLIFAIPWFAGVYAHCCAAPASPLAPRALVGAGARARIMRALAFALVLAAVVAVTAGGAKETYAAYAQRYQSWLAKDRQIDTVIPREVRERTPWLVWSTFYHPNKANRFWLWRPVVDYGWPARSVAFQKMIGFINPGDVPELARRGALRYIILESDSPLLAAIPAMVVKKRYPLEGLVILEL